MTSAPAFNVVRGEMVLEEPSGETFLQRRASVSHRFTKPDCRHCGGEDGIHYGRCEGFARSLSAQSPRWWFYRQVEKAAAKLEVRRAAVEFEKNQEALMVALKAALS